MVFADFLYQYFGIMGAYMILLMLGALALIVTGEFLITPIVLRVAEMFPEALKDIKGRLNPEEKVAPKKVVAKSKPKVKFGKAFFDAFKNKEKLEDGGEDEEEFETEDDTGDEENSEQSKKVTKPKIKIAPTEIEKANSDDGPIIVGQYTIPSLDLLEDSPKVSTSKIQNNLMEGAKLLEETLASFGVEGRVVDIERGPAITRYEIEPGSGVKVQKFTTLSDDIALAMKASTVRIVAPIPGKNRVGIEVPNDSSAAVYLKDVLSSSIFKKAESKLTLSLGKDVSGEALVADLADMPHLLIAGTTGSGKTVCVNGIIMSILLNATPDEVRFVMVDPKMVELAQYNDIPHLMCPVVTDAKKAAGVLNWVVAEMENRYKKLSNAGARNIKGYNAKGNHMPYIVVIIDELADLMQVAAKGVEGSIARLAQLSRAVGIHLILATQRPSVNVITGVIKANFPARISFKVASKIDSRTVLDANGAETLLGKGDMLFMKPGEAKPIRGQGNFVTDEEIHKVIQFIKDQQAPHYDETILESQTAAGSGGMGEKDECFDEALKLVMETNQASVSILQRRMRLGYTRAARLIDQMEAAGFVGPYVGSKPREILVDREQWLLDNMKDADDEQE